MFNFEYMERDNRNNSRILQQLFFLIIFAVVVLIFSKDQTSPVRSVKISEQHNLVLTGIIPVNNPGLICQNDLPSRVFVSKIFPVPDHIFSFDLKIDRRFFTIAQTCIIIGPDQALKSIFHLHYNKDDLPELS